jgi:multiple sugar transport system permease protein
MKEVKNLKTNLPTIQNVHKITYKDNFWALILLTPNLIGFLCFTIFPVIASFILSFTEYDILSPIKWVGIKNYINLLNDHIFKQVFVNTCYYSIVYVPLSTVLALLLAVALNMKIKGIKIYRTIYFLPVISPMVAVAIVWQWLYNSEFGLINYLLSLFGVKGPDWLTNKYLAMPAIIITSVWKNLGFNMLIFLAGLQGISDSYYEAADIEGASGFIKFTKITIPLLSSTTFFVVVMGFIGSFQVFDAVYLMTGGGPGRSTSVLVHYIYQNAFQYFKMGYACAQAYILFFVIFIITLIQFIFQRKWVIYDI